MPNVQAPDGSVIAFPDDMKPEDIVGVMQKHFPPGGNYQHAPQPQEPRSPMADTAAGAARGVAKGTADVFGIPADIFHVMDRGFQNGVLWAAQKTGLMSPEGAENYRQHAAAYQPTELPTSENLQNWGAQAAKKTGTYIEPPQTTAGKYAETIGEFAPSAALSGVGGGAKGVLGAIAKYGAVPGAASETAGELTEGTPAEPYARMAGAVAPFAGPAALNALKGGARGVAKEVSHLDPQQLQDAQTLLDQSRAAGAPVSVPQAINQVSNNATRLADMQRYVEQSKKGAPIMRQFYADQPANNEALAQQTLAHIANPGATLTETGANVQQAAQGAMRQANEARTQAVDPYYKRAATDQVPHEDMENFLQGLDAQIAADKTGLKTPGIRELRDRLIQQPEMPGQPRVPFTDIDSLDTIRGKLRDAYSDPQWMLQNKIDKTQAKAIIGRAHV